MTTLKVLIVEDEILIAETIRIYLEERGHSATEIVISFEEAVESYESNLPDIILLDVRLYGEKSGIDFANYLIEKESSVPFVFLTSQYDKRILENALQTNPNGYLAKPIQKESLWTTLELAFHKHSTLSSSSNDKKLHLHDGQKSYLVSESDIVYINSDHIYINIYLKDQSKIVIRQSLSDILTMLSADHFVQCHRGYIVNVLYISKFDNNDIYIMGVKVPISRSRRDKVLAIINKEN